MELSISYCLSELKCINRVILKRGGAMSTMKKINKKRKCMKCQNLRSKWIKREEKKS
jgi:hypothetical protein